MQHKTPVDAIAELGVDMEGRVRRAMTQTHQATQVALAEMEGAIAHTTHETLRTLLKQQQEMVKQQQEMDKMMQQTAAVLYRAALHTASVAGAMLEDQVTYASKTLIDWLKGWGRTASQQSYALVEQTTHHAGQVIDLLGHTPLLQRLSGVLKLDWLMGMTSKVDIEKAISTVQRLQATYPSESPAQIAHRLMVEKAIYAGGIGLASSLLPGVAAALLAVDLAATTALQTEMVYQIAAAYGMDLYAPARRGEVLAIFGLALGGRQALKAGLSLLRNTPIAGAVIGASTNATMLYSLGYTACRFYEAARQESASSPEDLSSATLNTLEAESDAYLEVAIAQQTIVDQLLVHLILARYPQQSWETILPNLAALQLSPASLTAIATHIGNPQPLESLIPQLNRDYAISLIAQCYRIAQVDDSYAPEANQMILALAHHFDLPLEAIRKQIAEASVGG